MPLDISTNYMMTEVAGDRTKITATITDEKFIGTHAFIIKSFNGLYNSVDSMPIYITIKDPCEDSVVNSDNRFKINNPFEVTLGKTEEVLNLLGPSNSASLE